MEAEQHQVVEVPVEPAELPQAVVVEAEAEVEQGQVEEVVLVALVVQVVPQSIAVQHFLHG